MLDRRHQANHHAGHAVAQAATLPSLHERRLRGMAEARAASDLAHRLVEAERARDAVAPVEEEGPARSAAVTSTMRGGDWAPVVIGIVLGALFLFAAGALAAKLGLWR